MADQAIEEIVRLHLIMLRAIGPAATAQVSNETSVARVIRKYDLVDAGIKANALSLGNFEKLLNFSKSKDGI